MGRNRGTHGQHRPEGFCGNCSQLVYIAWKFLQVTPVGCVASAGLTGELKVRKCLLLFPMR